MLKKTITYKDYNGVERTEDFMFNLTKAEILEMQLTKDGGMDAAIKKIVDAKDAPEIMKVFKDLILKSYGIVSDDGRRFIKSKEISDSFAQTEAFSMLFMELATDTDAASAFVNGIVPAADTTTDTKPAITVN